MRRMSRKKAVMVIMAIFFASLMIVSTAISKSLMMAEYPSPTLAIIFYAQSTPNWCGPDVLQSAIQSVNQYNDGIGPTPTIVPIIPKSTLWAYMRDNTCKDLGQGRDVVLPGNVGNAVNDVRKLNIAYDIGTDPHAMAWTMWKKTGANHFYHYWVYYNDVYEATRSLLYTLEKYHEPIMVAGWHGSHWILVSGYKSDNKAFPGPIGTIYQLEVANPIDGTIQWYDFSGNSTSWSTYWYTLYTNTGDPDPATGWYVPPPSHWYNHYVTIERDWHSDLLPDYGMSLNGNIPVHIRTWLPVLN